LAGEITSLDSEIAAAEAESAKYASGLLKGLIESRVQTLKQTRAMLNQRRKAQDYNVSVQYIVDGKPFQLPPDAAGQMASLEAEIEKARRQIVAQQAEVARYAGGLVQAMALTTLATQQQTLAMLEQRRLAIRYQLPQYLAFANTSAPSPAPASPLTVTGRPPAASADASGFEIIEIDARATERNDTWWRYAWKLTLKNSGSEAVTLRGTIEFQDKDGFVVDSDNTETVTLAAGTQQTLTGYALVTANVAGNVARTNAKVQRLR
jgi:hypothetical protein